MRTAWGVLFLFLIVNASTCSAQTVGASLQGTVYDPSGGFVPGAAIEVHNVGQGAVRALATDDKGRYREPLLPPGDRKSTRLNSSHANISYAVFCLKKKTKSESKVRDTSNRQHPGGKFT